MNASTLFSGYILKEEEEDDVKKFWRARVRGGKSSGEPELRVERVLTSQSRGGKKAGGENSRFRPAVRSLKQAN